MNSYQLAHATARRHAAETTSQLAAARALRLGGSAGQLPPRYFADANPAADLPDRGERGASRANSATHSFRP